MWGPLCLLWILIWTTSGAPSISTVCPENCECSTVNDGLKAHCSSTEFLGKLRPKQIHEIIELDISDTSVKIIDHKLRKLKNLRKLNLSKNNIEELKNFPYLPHLTHLYLSQNHIKQFTAPDLPKSIEHLDLSSNRIVNITDISKVLPNLVEINFNDNMLSCECDFLKYRDVLQQNDVHFVRPARCFSPENVRGISMLSVYCAFGKVAYDNWEDMLRDEPGSGEDIGDFTEHRLPRVMDFDRNEGLEEEDDSVDGKLEGEYFHANVDSSASTTESDEDSFEGSGSPLIDTRGSGDGDIVTVLPDPNVSHCFYNCSTASPIEDSNQSAPTASISEELDILMKEISGDKEPTTTTTTTIAPIKEEEIVKQKSMATLFEGVPKEEPKVQEEESDKIRAEVPTDLQTTATVPKKDNTTTYVVVGVLFAAMVVLIAYVVVKKRSQRNNNRRPSSNHDMKEPQPVEMKPLMTDPIPTKPIIVPERIPLVNGQNGTNKRADVDEPTNEEIDTTDSKPPVENGIDIPDEEEPQIRPKQEDDILLTPSTKRVTIQAKELSSPKSPVLVHRHLGDDGTIFITPPVSKSENYT